MPRKRSEPTPDPKTRRKLKTLSAKDWAALEKHAARRGPATGLGVLQEHGGRGIDKAARSIVSKQAREGRGEGED